MGVEMQGGYCCLYDGQMSFYSPSSIIRSTLFGCLPYWFFCSPPLITAKGKRAFRTIDYVFRILRGWEIGNDLYAFYAERVDSLKLVTVNMKQAEGVVMHWIDSLVVTVKIFTLFHSSSSSRPSRLPSALR